MSTATSTDGSPSHSPVHGNNAPKFGTLVPNRIFVGGILSNTTESELYEFFNAYGNVKETKIIADRAGVSKGYGFVTFETEEEAREIQKEESLVMKDHKLNIAPAIKKQAFSRTYSSADSCSSGERPMSARHPRHTTDWNMVVSPSVQDAAHVPPSGTIYYQAPTQYSYPSNYVYAAAADGSYSQQQAYYPMMYSPVYIPQQYYQSQAVNPAQWGGQPARWATPMGYAQNSCPQSNANSHGPSNSSSNPQYVYGGSAGSATSCPTTSGGCSQASFAATATTAVAAISSTAPALVVPSGSASVPISCYTPPYPPPGYCGAGDLMDAAILEATGPEQSTPTQNYNCGGRGGYQQRRGGPPSNGNSPCRNNVYNMQYNRQGFPRYSSPQQHYRQHKNRHMAPPGHLLLPTCMGDMAMTPPATPVEAFPAEGSSLPVSEATSRFNALAL